VPGDPGGMGIHIYRGIPATRGDKANYMYAVTVEIPRPEQGRHTHLHSYIWNLATRGGKEHFMYAVNVETPRSGQARHAHLRSYGWNLKNEYACVLQYLSGASSYRENPNNVYVYILYSRISARLTFT
jgi:hypothetical protein